MIPQWAVDVARQTQESNMDCQLHIREPGGSWAYNEATGQSEPVNGETRTTCWGNIQPVSIGDGHNMAAGTQELTISDYAGKIAWNEADLFEEDEVEVIAVRNAADARLVGKVFVVTSVEMNGFASTARRFLLSLNLG